jgi:hypothetical protein
MDIMRKSIPFLLLIFVLYSCQNNIKTELKFLDEFVLQDSVPFKNTIIGGLSGIDYSNEKYYLVVDDLINPRILISEINLINDTINNIKFTDVVLLKEKTSGFFNENILDLESVFVDDKSNEMYLVSEGAINKGKLPSIFKTNKKGKFVEDFKLPTYFTKLNNVKHNAAFEASSKSIDKKGFWVAMEGPLKTDGEEPNFQKINQPIRITYFDKNSKTPTKQFAYFLDYIKKPSKGTINLNGVTAIIEYKKNHFFIVERTYQNEFGIYGNSVKIYEASINKNTTNTIDIVSLKKSKVKALNKKLILDFDSIKNNLTNGIVDNIEGLTFGPLLSNGNKSLLLVSDDNFQIYGKQLNQFILLEIKETNQ